MRSLYGKMSLRVKNPKIHDLLVRVNHEGGFYDGSGEHRNWKRVVRIK
jgi:hypothetical protein